MSETTTGRTRFRLDRQSYGDGLLVLQVEVVTVNDDGEQFDWRDAKVQDISIMEPRRCHERCLKSRPE